MVFRFILAVAVAMSSMQASAKSWQEAIDDVSALAETYKMAAEELSGENITVYLGQIHSVFDIDLHRCAILGRRLGFAKHIGHLEPPQPGLDSDPQVLADNYASLVNWTYAAEWFAGVSQHERAKRWNLECVGKNGIPAGLWVNVPPEVFYKAEGAYLWVYGDVVPGFSERMRIALAEHPEVKTIGIGSGGGSVIEAIKAGRMVRNLGLSTQLSGECVSACPIFFLGGTFRGVMRPYPRLGFHQVSINSIAVPLYHPIYDIIGSYAQEMGANPDFFLRAMHNWEPNEMGYITPDQACVSGVVTWYQGAISSIC